jgi:hypothetical protein
MILHKLCHKQNENHWVITVVILYNLLSYSSAFPESLLEKNDAQSAQIHPQLMNDGTKNPIAFKATMKTLNKVPKGVEFSSKHNFFLLRREHFSDTFLQDEISIRPSLLRWEEHSFLFYLIFDNYGTAKSNAKIKLPGISKARGKLSMHLVVASSLVFNNTL